MSRSQPHTELSTPTPNQGSNLPWFLQEPFLVRVFLLGAVVFVLMYIRFVLLAGFNHDEVEHAQASFRILSGELPYRDFYQNHWPAHWLLTTQWITLFPFSVKAILLGRVAGLLALLGCWLLGLRLLQQVPGGASRQALIVYSSALLAFAFSSEFYIARPDNLMTLFATAGLCLVPAAGAIRNSTALILGLLFGLAFSMSSKMAPIALVVPTLIFLQAVRARSPIRLVALLPYGLGAGMVLLPTLLWLASNGLLSDFYFDVFGLNLALSKPWHKSFEFLKVAIFLPAWLGALAWVTTRRDAPDSTQNYCLVVLLALGWGLVLAYISRHAGIYNQQVLIVPVAVAFASLAGYLGMHLRDGLSRMVMLAALLAYPVSHTATQIALFKGNLGMPQEELQSLVDLARPGGRSCIGFSPVHPIWCHSISQLSNEWDLRFPMQVTDSEQQERFRRIWQEGMTRTLELQPDIIVRDSALHIWEEALEIGLIRQQDLDGLDSLSLQYDVMLIGESEVWLKKDPD